MRQSIGLYVEPQCVESTFVKFCFRLFLPFVFPFEKCCRFQVTQLCLKFDYAQLCTIWRSYQCHLTAYLFSFKLLSLYHSRRPQKLRKLHKQRGRKDICISGRSCSCMARLQRKLPSLASLMMAARKRQLKRYEPVNWYKEM